MHGIGFDEQATPRQARAISIDHGKRLGTKHCLRRKMAVRGGIANRTRPESMIVAEAKSAVPVGRFGHRVAIAGLTRVRNGRRVSTLARRLFSEAVLRPRRSAPTP